MTSLLKQVRAARKERHHFLPLHLTELKGLELPLRIPGDTPAQRVSDSALQLDAVWSWLPNGTPVNLLDPAARPSPWTNEHRIGFNTFYRAGVCLTVSTVFLGVETGIVRTFSARPDPILWETMIFQAPKKTKFPPSLGEDSHCWRYASREAARAGHRTIASLIRNTNRALRQNHSRR